MYDSTVTSLNPRDHASRGRPHGDFRTGDFARNLHANTIASAVITINTETEVERLTLVGLEASLRGRFINYEIIVVDNVGTALSSASRSRLLAQHRNVRWISLQKKQSSEKAVSVGLSVSIGDFVMLLPHAHLDRTDEFAEMATTLAKRSKRAFHLKLKDNSRAFAVPVSVFPRSAVNTITRAASHGCNVTKAIRELGLSRYTLANGQLLEADESRTAPIEVAASWLKDLVARARSRPSTCEFDEQDSINFRNPGIVELSVNAH
ncbi:hypothetical protein [Paraburkholderia rhizosphaerae]|uniref:Glycosyl transferase family 2 n=1 Tax=Paraburkholderia rhizosphaerae TaxID=480658 RepID=A0A4R8LL90_9BURK|nr:hypothetical protein [Paraburkholderia rhizosphaerae]TDY43321.1 hypothetical protein BX592_118116 [Paraburkholderia rhizosphaerae]